MSSHGDRVRVPDVMVAVPALDEAERIGLCLQSLTEQSPFVEAFVSDNASEDETASIASGFSTNLSLQVRTVDRIPPTSHFVSTARWALASSSAPVCALLAGDDTWAPDFAARALDVLDRNPQVDIVYPTFRWHGGTADRVLPPPDLSAPSAAARQTRALLLPDRRELANLLYGVYRRPAFVSMIDAWERSGDVFASDVAAAWAVLGRHRALPCPQAVAYRHERAGSDLLQRVGIRRADASGLLASARMYVELNLRINRHLAVALDGAAGPGQWRPRPWQLQVLRGPQWVLQTPRHAAGLLAEMRRGV